MINTLNPYQTSALRAVMHRRRNFIRMMEEMGVSERDRLRIAQTLIPEPNISSIEFTRCPISKREKQVIQLACHGLSNVQIADYLCVSLNTVKTHLANVFIKTGCRNRSELYTYAYQSDII